MVTKTESFALALQKVSFGKLANASFHTGDASLGVTLPDLTGMMNEITLNGSRIRMQAPVSCQVRTEQETARGFNKAKVIF